MKQIKITVKKVLLNFCSISGINIDNKQKSIDLLKNTKKYRKIKKEKKNEKSKENKDEENIINNNTSNKNRLIYYLKNFNF